MYKRRWKRKRNTRGGYGEIKKKKLVGWESSKSRGGEGRAEIVGGGIQKEKEIDLKESDKMKNKKNKNKKFNPRNFSIR